MEKKQDIELLAWLAGFFDGEGTFTIGVSQRTDMKFGFKVDPIISVGQKDSLEARKVLELIQQFAGSGCIHVYIRPSNIKAVDCQPFIVWQLRGVKRCKRFAETVVPFMRLKKDNVEKFIEICNLLLAREHWTEHGFIHVMDERDKIHNDMNHHYRTAKEFKEILQVKGG